jgi:hypothetical protein
MNAVLSASLPAMMSLLSILYVCRANVDYVYNPE